MPDLELDEYQKEAVIFEHDKPAVVTAAAGSGKTTLLVERVIRLLTDKSLGIDADSLAIMTFTRNATKSLREKLTNALAKKISKLAEEDSEEAGESYEHLTKQMFLLRQASISTIDSFCLKLIRENPEEFDLPVNFTVADSAKKATMQTRAIKATMQDFYNDADFTPDERDMLFFTFNFEDDRTLQETVIYTALELSSYADAEDWLKRSENVYKDPQSYEKYFVSLYKLMIDDTVNAARILLDKYKDIIKDMEDEVEAEKQKIIDRKKRKKELSPTEQESFDAFDKWLPEFKEEYVDVEANNWQRLFKYYELFNKKPGIDTLCDMLEEFGKCEPPRFDKYSSSGKSPASKKRLTQNKNLLLELAKKINETEIDRQEIANIFPTLKTAVYAFIKLMRKYRKYYGEIKISEGALDFSDCELMLLERLINDPDYCAQLGGRFSCIIVDEFQDSNDIQAEIFKRLGNGRLFYVGDIKQSIYAFRGGNPSIMAKLCDGEYGFKRLPLNKNYRSCISVIETVNAAFSGLMTREYGGVDYSPDNCLEMGQYNPYLDDRDEKYGTEIYFVSRPSSKKDKPKKGKTADKSAAAETASSGTAAVSASVETLSDKTDSVKTPDAASASVETLADKTDSVKTPDAVSDSESGAPDAKTEPAETEPAKAEPIDSSMLLPRFVAAKIKELHDDENFFIKDKEDKEHKKTVRPKYSDFAILLRNNTNVSKYRAALAELGIASTSPKGRSFLDSEEVRIVLNYLTVIDNPMKNEELLKVLMSPLYRFTAEDIAKIRLGLLGLKKDSLTDEQTEKLVLYMKRRSLFTCLKLCGEDTLKLSKFDKDDTPDETADYGEDGNNGGDGKHIPRKVAPNVKSFLSDLENFRYYMNANSLYKLVCKIYEDTDAMSVVAAFEDSAQRVANIRLLQEITAEFESHNGGSLGDFLRFIDRTRLNNKSNIEDASAPADSENAVSIMTFHGSKGLEKPVCIMSELQSTLRNDDYTGTMVLNRDHLFAFKHVDRKKRLVTVPLSHLAIASVNEKKLIGEELRLLYVAMTRAQEKLIMVVKTNYDKWKDNAVLPDETHLNFSPKQPFKWIFWSLLRKFPDNTDKDAPFIKLNGVDCKIFSKTVSAAAPKVTKPDDSKFDISEADISRLYGKIDFKYRYSEDTERQAKFSVTELAHKDSKMPIILAKPAFATGDRITGAEKGNAYHNCMQYLPLKIFKSIPIEKYEQAAADAVKKLGESGKLTEVEANFIDPKHIAKFLSSELGQRMLKCNSDDVYREEPIYAEIDGTEFGEAGTITVQGRIDAYFVEDGKLIVVDYKTDTPDNLEQEKENYAKQVNIYKSVLRKLTDMEVGGVYLYAFLQDEAIEI